MSQRQTIQFLINEIDTVLPNANSDPLKLEPEDIARRHRVLEKVQSYLRSLLHQPLTFSTPPANLNPTEQETAWRIAQAVLVQIDRSTSYPSEAQAVTELEQRRSYLQQEIRQLQAQHEQLVSESLQNLTAGFLESFHPQLDDYLVTKLHLNESSVVDAAYVKQLKQNLDQLLLNLDETLQHVFGTLEQDVHAYEQSLSQGIENIHHLGQQSEAIFSAYVKCLRERNSLELFDEFLAFTHRRESPDYNQAPTRLDSQYVSISDSASATSDLKASNRDEISVHTIRQLTDLLLETNWCSPNSSTPEGHEDLSPNYAPDSTPENWIAQEHFAAKTPTGSEELLEQNILQQLSADLERFEVLQASSHAEALEMLQKEETPEGKSSGIVGQSTVAGEQAQQDGSFYVTEDLEPSPWDEPPDT